MHASNSVLPDALVTVEEKDLAVSGILVLNTNCVCRSIALYSVYANSL